VPSWEVADVKRMQPSAEAHSGGTPPPGATTPRPLSAVIITLNEERNIARCLESLRGVADDIVVVDSGSVDRTEEICRSHGVNFIRQAWLGYSAQKNLANGHARHDWILSVDADEALSGGLRRSILGLKGEGAIRVCRFARLTNYCGHWVRHGGWYPDHKTRMFDRRTARWEGALHEELQGFSRSEVVLLEGDCLHYSYYTVEDHRRQADRFTTLAAEELFRRGSRVGVLRLHLGPVWKFILDYVLRLGFLDGSAGLRIASISAGATRMKYLKFERLRSGRRG
jgi:glycosyltransferase involved in cell wall biosynthesis